MKGQYFSTTFGPMYYRTKDGDANIHLVCIHGAGGDSRLFIPLMNEINNITVHAVDLPAHGKSKIQECSLDIYMQATMQFIQSLQGNVFVLGHSMGGGIIFELVKHDAPVKGALFLATAGTLPVNPVVFELLDKDFDSLCRLAVDLSYGSADETIRTTAIEYMKQAGSSILKNDFTICNNYNYEEDAKSFKQAACFIANRKDKMVPLDLTYTTFKKMPNAMLQVFPYKGHMLHIEQPSQVSRCIEQFVELSL
ncbi:MAG TPA: alpha/beta hydrolase [Spirochaetota bacterium]|nr:alpha/beta hydrolase [Spirochaetota bacterium]